MQLWSWCEDAAVVVERGCSCSGGARMQWRWSRGAVQRAVASVWRSVGRWSSCASGSIGDNRLRELLDHNSGAGWWVAAGRAVMAGDRCVGIDDSYVTHKEAVMLLVRGDGCGG